MLLAVWVTGFAGISVRPARLADQSYSWKGYNVRYQAAGVDNTGPSVLLVHGFGGNADHWRDNTAPLAAAGLRAYAIDLLGYGKSDKPLPSSFGAACGEARRGDAVTGTDKHPLGSGYNFYTCAPLACARLRRSRARPPLSPCARLVSR
jgi:pimeloyl-ACP methyl ester carboxylesterase